MREIKFRAWDGKQMYISPSTLEDLHHLGSWFEAHSAFRYTPKESENAIIMQYTGLKDKNGKEIYEGDIVRKRQTSTPEYIGEVFYSEVRCAFAVRYDRPSGYPRYADLVKCKWSESDGFHVIDTEGDKDEAHEVIGNIYSNPELLTPTP